MGLDLLIRGGTVYDGTGAPGRRADVGVSGDRVSEVGDLHAASAGRVIDATGLAVTPGFIDSHTHSDCSCFLPEEDRDVATGTIRQGVTTEVCGNCGFSLFPHLPEHDADMRRHIGTLFGSIPLNWNDLAGYRESVREAGIYSHLAPIVGHGSIRAGVMGMDDRPPDGAELRTMVRLVEESFEQGAVGISSGLVYSPGLFAETSELIALCRAVAHYGRPYITHMRGETHMVADSVREAITIAKAAGVPLHISHHKAAGKANYGRTVETLELIDRARRDGLDVTLDMYPYTAGSTSLGSMLPPWVQDGGLEPMLERLADRVARDQIEGEFETGLPRWQNLQKAAGWEGIFISSCPGDPSTEGRCVVELADAAGKTPAEFTFDLLLAQRNRVGMIIHSMAEDDVRRVLQYEGAMVGSDGIPIPGKPHPRWAGTFARVLGHYCRDEGMLDLATWVHKATGLPAQRFGLAGRGEIAPGKVADLVVFDPATIIDRATYDDPLLAPAGVAEVLVEGRFAVTGGQLTGHRLGRVLEIG